MPLSERRRPGTKGQEWGPDPDDVSRAMTGMGAPGGTEQGVGCFRSSPGHCGFCTGDRFMESEERCLDMPALQLSNDCDLNQVDREKQSSSGDILKDEQIGFADTLRDVRLERRLCLFPA